MKFSVKCLIWHYVSKSPFSVASLRHWSEIHTFKPTVSRCFILFPQLAMFHKGTFHVWFSQTHCIMSCVYGFQSVCSIWMCLIRWYLQTQKIQIWLHVIFKNSIITSQKTQQKIFCKAACWESSTFGRPYKTQMYILRQFWRIL
jgi:hypothetical protein